MYELLVLALLTHWPLHAYLIADIANNMLGPWEKISRGTLSALLGKLERDGYIAPADPAEVPFPSKHAARAFALTPAGRDRFAALMLDTTSNPGTYQRLFRIKSLHLYLLPPEEQRYLAEHYLVYCQTGLRYIRAEAEDFVTAPEKREHTNAAFSAGALDLMQHLARQWELEIAWAQRLRDRVVAAQTKDGSAAGGAPSA